MSDPNILIGYIEEALPTYQPDQTFFHRANDAVLASLPWDDEYPPLCRSLFATTGEDSRHASFRGRRLIHFAGHFNHFGERLNEWLTKFEALLRRLYWLEAEVYMLHTWSARSICLNYQVTADEVRRYASSSPEPPHSWEVVGHEVKLTDGSESEFLTSIMSQRSEPPHGGGRTDVEAIE